MEYNNVSIYSSVFRIGVVHSVDGRVVKVLVDKDKNNRVSSSLFLKTSWKHPC